MTVDDHPRAAEFLALLQARLKPKTQRHSRGVADALLAIGQREGLNPMRCIEAGLLHDAAKHLKKKAYLEEAARLGIPIGPVAREKPMLLHGPIAAEEARRNLGLDDPDLYEAIYWHTTGKPALGRLGLALILADFAEPNRPYPEAAQARYLLEQHGFEAALRFVATQKLAFVQANEAVDPLSQSFHEWVMETSAP